MAAAFLLLAFLVPIPGWAGQQPDCGVPPLSDRQILRIMGRERETRKDLPPLFPQYTTLVRRRGCLYVYIEQSIPAGPEMNNSFLLNRQGVIVDVHQGNGPSCCLKCPDKVLSESDLAAIVRRARTQRKDLPPPFPKTQVLISRQGCLYRYTEFALPEMASQSFTIDPLGELMDVTHHPAPPPASR